MKNTIKILKTKYFLISALFFILTLSVFLAFTVNKTVFADNYFNVIPFNIKTELELTDITSPTDMFIDDEGFTVIDNENITIYSDEVISIPLTVFEGDVKHITKLSGNSYLLIDNAKLRKIVINADNSYTVSELKALNLETLNYETITGNVYDFNGNKLVVGFEEKITYYSVDDNYSITKLKQFSGVDSNRPVLLNGDSLFYINGNLLYKSTIPEEGDTLLNTKTVSSSANSISKMIFDSGYIYYIGTDKNIYKVSENGGTITKLSFSSSEFELGTTSNPSALYFYNGHLYIADANGSIQQFLLSGNTLSFTGYALANGKSAFNRIDKTAFDVEKYGEKIAVLSSNKITVINTADNDTYNASNYETVINDKNNYSAFALGQKQLLLANTQNKYLNTYDLETKTLSNSSNRIYFNSVSSGYIADVCYQNGYFYILQAVRSQDEQTKNRQITVYKLQEGTKSFSKILTITKSNYFSDGELPIFEVSENGTIFIATRSIGDSKIYRYEKDANGNYNETDYNVLGENDKIIKLKSDFNDNLYALYDNSVACFIGEDKEVFNANGNLFSSFSFSIEENKAYFISSDKEVIYSSDELPIVALNDMKVPKDYVINGSTDAKPIDELKLYSVKNPENAYIVEINAENNFSLLKVAEGQITATKICDFKYSSDYSMDDNKEMIILISFDDNQNMQTVLTAKDNVSEIAVNKTDALNNIAYVSTSVSVYYLPIITEDTCFAMTYNGKAVRLDNGTQINIIKKINYLGVDYYYAETTVNEVKYTGYIPVNFTATVLPSNIESQNFYTATTHDCDVYSSSDMEDVIYKLSDGDVIRVYDSENGILKIYFFNGKSWQEGYVYDSVIKSAPNTTTRNVIIICVVALSLCGTLIFFIVKKKTDF